MSIFRNIFGGLKTTVVGLFTGIGAGAAAAATQFATNPQTSDWKPYAAAGAAALIPALVGAFAKDPQPEPPAPAKKVSDAIVLAGEAYTAQKADEMIAKLQKELSNVP
jgi:hypothetical protein